MNRLAPEAIESNAWDSCDVRVRDSVESMLRLVPVPAADKRALVAAMGGPTRRYHGLGHLATLWDRHVTLSPRAGLSDPFCDVLMACSIAYHDAVYLAGAKDNEELSARLWLADSAATGMDDGLREWVAGTIRATADHLSCPDEGPNWRTRLRQWMVDLDLTPLGEEPDVFDRNTDDLRFEFSFLSDEAWDAGRLAFLRQFAACDRIYRTPAVHGLFEGAARANLARQMLDAAPSP